MTATPEPTLKLTPMVRWMVSFGREVDEFPEVFDQQLLDKLASRYHASQAQVVKLAQTVVRADFVLLFTLTTPQLKGVKLLGLDLSTLQFLVEFSLLATSLAFFFLAWNFTTSRAYEAMVWNICDNYSDAPNWNGHFLAAAYIHQDLALHVASARLHADDAKSERLAPSGVMVELERSTNKTAKIILVPLLLFHMFISSYAIYFIYKNQSLGPYLDLLVVTFSVAVALCTFYFHFKVHVIKQNFSISMDG